MTDLNICDELSFDEKNGLIKFTLSDISTNWLKSDDAFIKRIARDNINPFCPVKHLKKEIEIKNTLDEGTALLDVQKYPKAIDKFDKVLFYDDAYGEALLFKSFALKGQRHYVKSLRYYKRTVKADSSLKDIEYHKSLLKLANDERDNFPKLKLNIYAGDEYFAKGDYERAIESYNRALLNPSKFRDKILSKLLNKKATAYVKLNDLENALNCFEKSLEVEPNDYAVFFKGFCEYKLNGNISNNFKGILDISKPQMLKQIEILNDLGYFRESMAICDFLWQNHFKTDDFYFKLAETRKSILRNLDMDLTEINEILDLLCE